MPPATTKTATVAAYLRVSSQAQRQRETIASQREAVLDHGRSLGWAIPDDLLFADDGFSGATLERPALDALRDGVARGEIETVLVWSIDRLSRNFAHQILLQEEFARSGATIQCAQEPDDATPQGMLLRQILSVISEYERTQIAERSRRGKIHRARQGSLNMLTRAPYGYRLIRKTETCGARFEIDETEAGVVRRIFDLYAGEGLKMHQIARRLDEEGLSPRHSRHWPISTVAVILRNEAYIGKAAYLKTTGSGQRVRHNRTGRQKGGAVRRLTGRVTRPREDWIELPVPAIVDPALFARAQRQREANRRFSGRKTVEPTLLQGLCVCAHCGYAMGRNSGNSSRKTPRLHYYRCHGTEAWRHPEGAVCDNPAVRADELDAAVWTEVLALLEDPDLIQGEITRRLEAANDTTDIRQRTDSLQGELARITTRMRRLLDAYQEEVMTLDELREAKTPLQARQDSIQSELRSLKAAELDRGARLSLAASAEQFLGRLREGGRSLSLAERQRIVRLLVREVRVGKDAVTICHSIPIPASPPHGSDPSGDKPGQKKLLDSRCRRVVEDRRQRLRQQGLRDLQRPAADRLDPPVVEHVHAAVDVVQVQRQLAMGVEFANRGALGQRSCDPRQHQLLDDAVGARPARPEQAVPAEKVVDGAEGLPDPDDDPALLAAIGQVGSERRGIADRAPGLLEKIDEFLRREQGGPGAVGVAHLLDDEAGEAFELLELGRAGRRADMAQDALADLAAAAHGLDDLDLDAVSGELLPSHEHGGMMAAGGRMSRENTTEGTTTPISPAGAKRINYTRRAEVESPVKGLNSRSHSTCSRSRRTSRRDSRGEGLPRALPQSRAP